MGKVPRFRINKLAFMNREEGSASLEFPAPLSFVYGASNTGKSFAVKAIDFMMGGRLPLRDRRQQSVPCLRRTA